LKKQAKVTSKGQITIPIEIRRALGVGPGDRVVFDDDSGNVHVRAAPRSSRLAKYRGIGNPKMPSGRKAIVAWLRKFRGQ
jgi:AbrB family looped-hinge helix DNA binding protein